MGDMNADQNLREVLDDDLERELTEHESTTADTTTERDGQDDTNDPDGLTLPDGCPLGKLYRKRKAQGRDLTVLIADWNLERGSGKTTLALRLAGAADRTDDGVTPDKASLNADELTEAYTSKPKGSSLVFDEAEAGISNRRAMSGVNEAMRQIVGMGRIEQKYLFLTAPGVHQVDKDIRAMCDVWILVREVGKAQMYRVRFNPFDGHALTDDWGTLTWNPELPGPLQNTYDRLTDDKRAALRGEGDDGAGYVAADEAAEKAQRAAEKAERQARDSLIRTIYDNANDKTQQELADEVGLSRSRIADILTDE
jgi:ABC-type dipeptide/oligopeptide/nickel transport system ATPase subunit